MQIVEYFNDIENIELYLIASLFVFTVWFILNTFKFYKGEKRKVKHLHRFAKEGEAEAQHHLAKRYQKGICRKKKLSKGSLLVSKGCLLR